MTARVERYALRQFLAEQRGTRSSKPGGGYEGLRMARQAQPEPDLRLAMPDVHGLEVLKMLKAIDETRGPFQSLLFTSQRPDDIRTKTRRRLPSALLLKSELSREAVAAVIRRANHAQERSIMASTV